MQGHGCVGALVHIPEGEREKGARVGGCVSARARRQVDVSGVRARDDTGD